MWLADDGSQSCFVSALQTLPHPSDGLRQSITSNISRMMMMKTEADTTGMARVHCYASNEEAMATSDDEAEVVRRAELRRRPTSMETTMMPKEKAARRSRQRTKESAFYCDIVAEGESQVEDTSTD